MICPTIPSMPYSEFSGRLHARATEKRIPAVVSMELTFRCNLRCGHCYCNVPAGEAAEAAREMTSAEVCALLDELADEGCLWLLITGGEPLLRQDFADIYMHAKRLGMLVILFTNGTLMNEGTARMLADYRPFNVELSLYGADAATYGAVTGASGAFERFERGVALLRDYRVPFSLKTPVTRLNAHGILRAHEYAKSLGAEFRYDAMINARIDAASEKSGPASQRISPADAVALDKAMPLVLDEWSEAAELAGPAFEGGRMYFCAAGLNGFHIDPYGRQHMCIMSREPGYDLLRGSVREGWCEHVAPLRQLPSGDTECARCGHAGLCPQCAGWAALEHGHGSSAPVRHICETARLRRLAINERQHNINTHKEAHGQETLR